MPVIRPAEPPTPKGRRVATAILDAAIETIADGGAANASLQRIADRAEVDKRVLRYYFGDRDGLMAAIVARIGDRLLADTEQALAEIVDPEVGFAIGFERLWSTVKASPRLHAAYLELVAASISDGRLRESVVEVRNRYDRLILDRADAAEDAGFVWAMPKPAMSALVLAALQGLTMDYLQRGETQQLRLAIDQYRGWLAGLAARAG